MSFLQNVRIRINLPFMSYEITPAELLSRRDIDERIAKLEKVRADLLDAVDAVKLLEDEAHTSKDNLTKLNDQLLSIRKDKETIEKLLQLPENSFSRIINKATRISQFMGLGIGFLLGIAASFIATWLWETF